MKPESHGRWGAVDRSKGKKDALRDSLRSDKPPSQTKSEVHRSLEERGVVRPVDRERNKAEREAKAQQTAAEVFETYDAQTEEGTETGQEEMVVLSEEVKDVLSDLGVDVPPSGYSTSKEVEDAAYDAAEEMWNQADRLKVFVGRVKNYGGFYRDQFGVSVPLIRENDPQNQEMNELKALSDALRAETGLDDVTAVEAALIDQRWRVAKAMDALHDAGYDVPEYPLSKAEREIVAKLDALRAEHRANQIRKRV